MGRDPPLECCYEPERASESNSEAANQTLRTQFRPRVKETKAASAQQRSPPRCNTNARQTKTEQGEAHRFGHCRHGPDDGVDS